MTALSTAPTKALVTSLCSPMRAFSALSNSMGIAELMRSSALLNSSTSFLHQCVHHLYREHDGILVDRRRQLKELHFCHTFSAGNASGNAFSPLFLFSLIQSPLPRQSEVSLIGLVRCSSSSGRPSGGFSSCPHGGTRPAILLRLSSRKCCLWRPWRLPT